MKYEMAEREIISIKGESEERESGEEEK